MTDKKWREMGDRAEGLMDAAAKEYQALTFDGGLSATDKRAQSLRIRRRCVEKILRLALSPEEALGAAQKG